MFKKFQIVTGKVSTSLLQDIFCTWIWIFDNRRYF